ncbi:MAG TPA: hypothetical protein VI670_02005, partial [Thermoanaerobaculia bacterium]
AAVLTFAPWVIRSSLLAGRFVMISTNAFSNLEIATVSGQWNINDQASIFRSEYFKNVDPCTRRSGDPLASPRAAAEIDRVCLHQAIENVRRNPGYYARTRLSQLGHFPLTSFDFATGNLLTFGEAVARRAYGALLMKGVLYAIFSLAPLVMGVVGVLFGTPTIEKRLAAALWIFVFVIYAPGFVEYRYFLSAVPMLLVTAAFGAQRITSRT